MLDKNHTQDLSVLSTIIDFSPEPFATRRSFIFKDYSFIELKLARHDQLDYGWQEIFGRFKECKELREGRWMTRASSLSRLHHSCAPLFGSCTCHMMFLGMFQFSQK